MGRRYTIEAAQTFALSRGGKCLSVKYKNNRTKLSWQCDKGHIWEATMDNVRRGTWCPICGKAEKLGMAEIQKLAASKGGKCLSSDYLNNYTKLIWECSKGHVWEAVPSGIKRGRWCPECSKKRREHNKKYSIKDMQMLAAARNGKCLSRDFLTTNTKLTWQCEKGHIWDAVPSSLLYEKSWCPVCAVTNRVLPRKDTRRLQTIVRRISTSDKGIKFSRIMLNFYTKFRDTN